jgi:membrane-bound metal-dependent hydrolase YbcI (DUF457 family)
MFAGHFGLAAIVRSKEKTVPLWVLMLSTQLLDVVFIPLLLLGIETIQPIGNKGYGEQIIHAEYTHSLVGALVIAGVAGFFAKRKWGQKGGLLVAAMVFSHWILDLLVHRMDMPILPGNLGNLPLLGIGLWQYQTVSILIEGLLVLAGIILYFTSVMKRADHANRSRAILSGIVMSILLGLSLIISIMGW